MFLQRFGGRFKSPEEARRIYRKAQQVSSVAFNLFTGARKIESAPELQVTAPPAETRPTVRQKALDTLVKQFPTLETLFGPLDFCECEHCRSVLGPAAYLVELFQFLDPEQPAWKVSRGLESEARQRRHTTARNTSSQTV